MKSNKINNFSIAREQMKYKTEDLKFTTKSKKEKKMVGLTYAEKVNHVHQRQRRFVDNMKTIYGLKKKIKIVDEKRAKELEQVIAKLEATNNLIEIEIEKFRIAARLENQEFIKDCNYYTETLEKCTSINKQKLYYDLMEKVLLEDSEFFSKFVAQSLKQSTTTSLIGFLTPILKDHGYNVVEAVIEA